ncbi:MAG: hypothetical protein ACPGJV_04285 [Bacteriovoracaceae bacterium]
MKCLKSFVLNQALSLSHEWYVDSHPRKAEMIALGVGWDRLSLVQIEQNEDLVAIPEEIVEPLLLEVHFMRNKMKPHGPMAQKIWKLMLEFRDEFNEE